MKPVNPPFTQATLLDVMALEIAEACAAHQLKTESGHVNEEAMKVMAKFSYNLATHLLQERPNWI